MNQDTFSRVLTALLCLACAIVSCKTAKTSVQRTEVSEETELLQPGEKTQLQRFVSVEAVSELRTGMTIEQVYAVLGSNPYNLLSAQSSGHHIVQYKYRLTNIEVPSKDVNNGGIEQRNNKTYYLPDMQDLYIVFNGSGKMEYLVTSQGGITEKLLRSNNLLYVIKKEKDKFEVNTEKEYRSTNAGVFYPMMPCTNCDLIRAGLTGAQPYVPPAASTYGIARTENSAKSSTPAGENSSCSSVVLLMSQIDAGQSIVQELSEVDLLKNSKEKLRKLVDAEKKYAEQVKVIEKGYRALQADSGTDACSDYKVMQEKKKKMEADYTKRSTLNSKGVGSKILSKTLSGL